jgi:four helix bundle protein
MNAVASYRDLKVWQKSMDWVVACYRVSESFPKTEMYGMRSQLQRAAASVPANIAEGRGRRSTRSFLHFLDIAYGSLMESETFIMLAGRLGFLDDVAVSALLVQTAEIGRMLNGLMNSLSKHETADATECRSRLTPES